MLVCFITFAREAAGAAGTRHSLRPQFFRANDFCTTRANRAVGTRGRVLKLDAVIARSAAQRALRGNRSNPQPQQRGQWIALSPTVVSGAHRRAPWASPIGWGVIG